MTEAEAFAETITGALCLALYAQEYVHEGEVVTPVTVLFLQFEQSRWARFGIDAEHFHWREVSTPDTIPSTVSDGYPLTDVGTPAGTNGRHVASVDLRSVPPIGATLTLTFSEGGTLALVNADDASRLEFGDVVV